MCICICTETTKANGMREFRSTKITPWVKGMYFFSGPKSNSVDVWTELQQRASSPQGDITCSPGLGIPGEGAELLLTLGG